VRVPFIVVVAPLLWAPAATAEEARYHVTGAAAHAVGGPQQREFGGGGGGSATVELPVGKVLGVQASGGGLVLAEGKAPADLTLAKQGTGNAFLGTVGVRFRPLGAMITGGPWIDANGGLAQTGSESRVAVDSHLGWDFRVARDTRWDLGPFVGYTQIIQPSSALRPDDARIVWAGLQLSLGARERVRELPPPKQEQPEPPLRDRDGFVEVQDYCPPADEDGAVPAGCPAPEVKLVGDRIVIDDVIHFEFGSPRIRRKSTTLVHRVAQFIADHTDIVEISIEGHADARGTEEFNQRLSEQRAESTRAMLVQFGVPEASLRVVGHGKSHLKIPTPLPEERNRRVEFIVVRTREASGPPAPPRVAIGKRGGR
jgi:outer membrane protein OmpA-like peptidoglycan-associated protein